MADVKNEVNGNLDHGTANPPFNGGDLIVNHAKEALGKAADIGTAAKSPVIDGATATANSERLAQSYVGQELWTERANETQQGRLGAAAAVSKVLRDSGVPLTEPVTSVRGLEQRLLQLGYTQHKFEERQAGDVIIAHGKMNHVGIQADHKSFMNSSIDGKWKSMPDSYWKNFDTYTLRAPKEFSSTPR